jgi:ParB-like chromosome segregation protein Spo0J
VIVRLPTDLVARYRAVDREHIWAPAYVVDTPAHLDALTEDVGEHGILVPLSLTFNSAFGALDGNHRIAVALRLGLSDVPVLLTRVPEEPRPAHAKSMAPADLAVIERAYDLAVSDASPGQGEQTAHDEDRRSG